MLSSGISHYNNLRVSVFYLRLVIVVVGSIGLLSAGCNQKLTQKTSVSNKNIDSSSVDPPLLKIYSVSKKEVIMVEKIIKKEEEWRKKLTAEQYHVTREKGTEIPFSGQYNKSKENGANLVKFQTWSVDRLKSGPWDEDGRLEIYKKAELSKDQHLELFEYSSCCDVGWAVINNNSLSYSYALPNK